VRAIPQIARSAGVPRRRQFAEESARDERTYASGASRDRCDAASSSESK
jgi:hypothetical protein